MKRYPSNLLGTDRFLYAEYNDGVAENHQGESSLDERGQEGWAGRCNQNPKWPRLGSSNSPGFEQKEHRQVFIFI